MTAAPTLSVTESESTRTTRHVLSVILRDPLSLASTIIIVLFILLAIFAYQIAPYPEEGAGKTHASNTLLPPSAEHCLAQTNSAAIY
jgi:ABC-type antimicrobial peptide transport system permease subunit